MATTSPSDVNLPTGAAPGRRRSASSGRSTRTRRLCIGALLGLAAAALAMLVSVSSLGRGLEDDTYDRRLRATARQQDARQDIAIVLINESSLRALEPAFGAWPWPRLLYAGVIDFLSRAQARVIAMDLLFLEHDRRSGFDVGGRQMTGEASDTAFVTSVAHAGNVVILADATFEGMASGATAAASVSSGDRPARWPTFQPGPGFEHRLIRYPFSELANAAAAVGHNFAVQETNAVARRQWPFVDVDGSAIPSLGLAAALLADRIDPANVRLEGADLRVGSVRMPLLAVPTPARQGETPASSRQVLLNFHGPYQSVSGQTTYPVYSFFDVLLSEDKIESGGVPAIDPALFRDKIVFIGTSADGLGDIWRSPFAGGGMPGVQLHAALVDDVRSGRFMRRASTSSDVVWTLSVAIAGGVAATFLPVMWAVPAVLAAAAVFGWYATHLLAAGLWIAVVPPVAGLAIALFEGVAWQYFVEGREKRKVAGLFGRYVSKDVFDLLMADPSVARLGGERREMTVLFSDIRGFTSASERSTPENIVHQLNEYFSAMVDVLFRHQGTLDKFVGDMVMGLFGAPVADARHADHAVAAALEMTAVLRRLNADWSAAGRPVLDIGIGINSGEMIAGNIGSDTIMSYTVIGDAVNLGARLESLNKDYGTKILISEETRRRLTIAVETRAIGEVAVKGRTQPVMVYEITDRARGRGEQS